MHLRYEDISPYEVYSLSIKRIALSLKSEEDVLLYKKDPNLGGYSLYEEDSFIGYILYRLSYDYSEIDEIAIKEEYEGRGYATKLLEYYFQKMKEKKINKIFLEVREDNKKALSLYQRNGFIFYKKRKNYYGTIDAYCYYKELDDER